MSKQEIEQKKCLSFKEFRKSYYPKALERDFVKSAAPKDIGLKLADKSIIKIRASISDVLNK